MRDIEVTHDIKPRLEEARKAKAKREEARRAQHEQLELEALTLEEKLEAELGPRGQFFDIVETVEGPIAVRLGEAVVFKAYTASKMEHEQRVDFVTPCIVHPAKDKALEILHRRPGVILDLTGALGALYRGKDSVLEGKA